MHVVKYIHLILHLTFVTGFVKSLIHASDFTIITLCNYIHLNNSKVFSHNFKAVYVPHDQLQAVYVPHDQLQAVYLMISYKLYTS